MSALALSLLLATVTAESQWDLRLLTGFSLKPSSTSGTNVAFGYGVGAGFDLRPATTLPLRAELLFVSDTHGGGTGVDAVDVSAWQGQLIGLFGFNFNPVTKGDKRLFLEVMAGPGLRVQRVSHNVFDQTKPVWDAGVFAAFVGGIYYGYKQWRFGLRVLGGLPRDRTLEILLAGGYNF